MCVEHRIQVIRDEQVQFAVAIVVDQGAAGAPAGSLPAQTGLLRDVGEGAVAVVAVQDVLSPVGDEQIVKAVVIVVADARPPTPSRSAQAGLVRDIGERAVPIVLVQPVRAPCGRPLEAGPAEDEDVQPAVVVVIEEGAAAADGFDDVALGVDPAIDDRRAQARPASARR